MLKKKRSSDNKQFFLISSKKLASGRTKRDADKSFILQRIEVMAVVIAALALIMQLVFSGLQYFEWRAEAKSRHEERVVRAWQILTSESPGNGGMVQALEFLAKNDISLRNIDLSCKSNGGDWREKGDQKACVTGRPYLRDLDLSTENIGHSVDLTEANFDGADLINANFSGAILWNASFINSNLAGAKFKNAILYDATFDLMFSSDDSRTDRLEDEQSGADFRGAELGYTTFRDAYLDYSKFDGELSLAHFDNAYISNTDFSNARMGLQNPLPGSPVIKLQHHTYQHVFGTSWIYPKDPLPKFPDSDKEKALNAIQICRFVGELGDPEQVFSEPGDMKCEPIENQNNDNRNF